MKLHHDGTQHLPAAHLHDDGDAASRHCLAQPHTPAVAIGRQAEARAAQGGRVGGRRQGARHERHIWVAPKQAGYLLRLPAGVMPPFV